MAFNNRYTRTLERSGGYHKGQKSTILPFFGFKYETSETPYTQTVWVSDSYSRTGRSAVSNTEYDKHEHFVRTETASDLERRFCALIDKPNRDIWYTTYIPTSVQEYYENLCTAEKTGRKKGCLFAVVSFFLVLVVVSGFLKNVIDDDIRGLLLIGVPTAFGLFGKFLDISKEKRVESYLNKHPYHSLSAEAKERMRKSYFAYMTAVYGAEAGAILQEYAKLKGYDR